MAHLYGYARVSTTDQDPALQVDALEAAGCVRIFTDKVSGKLEQRPQLDKLLDVVLPGDVIVVWRLDRLGRSLKHLVGFLSDLGERGVEFRSLSEAIDTTTASGKLLFNIMGSLAEFERSLIVERTRAGLAAARARGRNGGRPRKVSERTAELIRQLYNAQEQTVDEIAETFGISRTTVYRSLEPGDRRSTPPPAASEATRRKSNRKVAR